MRLSDRTVFLSAPFSQWLASDGLVVPQRRAGLERLREFLLAEGAWVFSPHHNEDWGSRWLSADLCTPADFAAMAASDLAVAILGDPISPGVALELGWASAHGTGIVLVVGSEQMLPPLLEGLHTVTPTAYLLDGVDFTDETFRKITDSASNIVSQVAPRSQCNPSALRSFGFIRSSEVNL